MNKVILVLVFLFLSSAFSIGQINFRKGLVVTTSQDTLVGLIKDCGKASNSKQCFFKESRNSEIIKYSPRELSAYHIFEYKKYVSRIVLSGKKIDKQFIEVLFEGEMNLYNNYKGKDVLYFAEKPGENMVGLISKTVGRPKPRNGVHSFTAYWLDYEYNTMNYRDTLISMMSDQKEIASQVFGVEYDVKSLISLFKVYTELNCEGKNCVTYEKDTRIGRDRFGIYTGIDFFNIDLNEHNFTSPVYSSIPVGILANIPLSIVNERLSLQFELSYAKRSYGAIFSTDRYLSVESEKVSLPISLQYKFAARKFSPRIGIGKSMGLVFDSNVYTNLLEEHPEELDLVEHVLVYRFNNGSVFYDLGVDYDIKPQLSVFTTLRFMQYYGKIIEEANSNYSTFKNAKGLSYRTNSISLIFGLKF